MLVWILCTKSTTVVHGMVAWRDFKASTTLLPEIEYFFPLKKQQLVLMSVFVFGVVPRVLNMASYSFRVPRPQTSLEEGD